MTGSVVIRFEDVSFSFLRERPLFEGLSLSLLQGAFYLIGGPSGSGKSTFLRLINRLEELSAGTIRFKGRPLKDFPPPVLRRSVLFIQQTPAVVAGSVQENLLLPFSFRHNQGLVRPSDQELRARLDRFLPEGVQLEAPAEALSVGQLQRLCFVRGLLLAPEVLLLDEPTSALDERSARIVEDETERLCREAGMTVVMVSHRRFEPRIVEPVRVTLLNGQWREGA